MTSGTSQPSRTTDAVKPPRRASRRGPVRYLGDATLTRMLRLPPGGRYTVARLVVPMRDRVMLLADHYAPAAEPSDIKGTLLVRSPYGRGFPISQVFAQLYAARGYHVVVQSVRGTFGSGGEFEPMTNEAADGADTVTWLRRQPWFTGSFGTVGLSYLGLTQWALLADPPPELATAVIVSGLYDFSASTWGTGAFALNDFLGWSNLMAHQEDGGRIRAGLQQLTTWHRVARATEGLPLGAAGRALIGTGAPWYESWLEHPDLDDPFWRRYRFDAALERTQVPVLLIGGWQDLLLEQTLAPYRRLRDRGVDAALTIGPWSHSQMLTKGLATVTRESLSWLDTHLAGDTGRNRSSRVRVAVTGGTGRDWRDLPDWPPPTSARQWYLQPDGGLTASPPASESGRVEFRYDPAEPTPGIGGPVLSAGAGYRDDTRLAGRDDVLTFTTDPLTEDLYVFGNPVVELAHACDNPHADLFVRVSAVDSRGRSRNVSDGFRRLRDEPGLVHVDLGAIAHRFAAGSRIRVLIAGGCHPRYARNLGTGEPPASGVRMRPATHTVRLGDSRLTLPIGVI